MAHNVILLGAPGSGKGTQAAKLVEAFGLSHISTGELLRAEMAKESELGERVSDTMQQGRLVDDQTVLELLVANCDLASKQYIFDGFPRNLDQAKMLDDQVVKDFPTTALYLEIDLEKLTKRLINRRSCSSCGEIYNLLSTPPQKTNSCDKCGGDLQQRKDDTESVVKNRMEVFTSTIDPLVKYYDERGILKRVVADDHPDQVFAAVEKLLG
ncbi:MAG: nucleoside monophosphate kinase [Bdellovibrionales bacterium]|jgi:adenylate kinase|nr:nucleoside monophosphate kinase [Bdellovibrionales bacterium]MBT3526013.1 nucleoside monophosphate kinase [Bdellovibrionales bacterium]MBT7669157.1 nucleoside monophosphate kinase [Bdellovibrionales bacterium]